MVWPATIAYSGGLAGRHGKRPSRDTPRSRLRLRENYMPDKTWTGWIEMDLGIAIQHQLGGGKLGKLNCRKF
ncbi:hypothetical protein ColTof4_14341 [Colletotrichum tofieldiae]|nr:hypothetical protein ColTof3_14752 [Colletotrichum tofieldiae]GKT81918.1 hypothetical protein ColTof4_14341 [Colletotrichum tofieldiae]